MRHNFDERWQGENYDANVKAVRQLTEFATSRGITVAQLALAWLLAQGQDIVPIPGTRNPIRLAENVAAVDVNLNPADLDRVYQIFPHGAFGSRYHPAIMPEWK
jgi:aryl-alcohol dehydrogenase-like predicted oxidoreductase